MNKYPNLLSPIRAGNIIIKNRLLSTKAIPTALQGPENYPSDATITHMANMARAGAAIVTCNAGDFSTKGMSPQAQDYAATACKVKDFPSSIIRDFAPVEILRTSVQPYFAQMADAIHFYGSLATVSLMGLEPKNVNIAERQGPPPTIPPGMEGPDGGVPFFMEASEAISEAQIQDMINSFVEKALLFKYLGFDMVTVYMSYGSSILARSLSPVKNTRTDQYGGSFENRARLTLELFGRIKEACGENFLIEAQVSGEETGGYTLDDLIRYAKMCEGLVDIFQLRAPENILAEPTGFNYIKQAPMTLRYAEALKESGCRIITAPNGGFGDPDLIERFIASGKTDMVAMGREFISEPEYVKKLRRWQEVVPCIRCGRCHGAITSSVAMCSVNPKIGLEHKLSHMIGEPEEKKKVAVIGGGPAGMEAAIICARRGHSVTLYEKNEYLGGQLHHSDFAAFKWPVKDYKDYLIRQLDVTGVKVKLGAPATADMVKKEGYDVVLAALGARPKPLNVKGADSKGLWYAADVFGREAELGKRVVIVGGSETGTETGMYLAECGHEVTVITRQRNLAHDAVQMHYPETIEQRYRNLPNFSYITRAETMEICAYRVTYRDREGRSVTLEADTVVLSSGMASLQDEAMKFASASPHFQAIGDCVKVANIHSSVRSAFAAASNV